MNRSQKLLLLLIISILSSPVSAQVSLPKLISDGMVLQRDHELKLWGWTSPGEDVALTFKGRIITTTAGRDGNWEIRIPAQNAGGSYKMVFEASNRISVENILFGDVWVSSGQSNMELIMERVKEKYREIIEQSENPDIRQGHVIIEFDNIGGGLVTNNGEPSGHFSISGDVEHFVWAKAEIEGESVKVWNDQVTEPAAVRYAWAYNPEYANLYNKHGLPASPFEVFKE